MSKPPKIIDGAKVIEWAWSGATPFGVIKYSTGEIAAEVFGLAICKYPDSDVIYRFSCDYNWETMQDCDFESMAAAKANLPLQYMDLEVVWQLFE